MFTSIANKFIVRASFYDEANELVAITKEFDYLNGAINEYKHMTNYCTNYLKWIVTLVVIDTVNSVSLVIDSEGYLD